MTTTPYHPQGNGVVEHFHGTLKPMLAKASQQGLDWVRFLPLALFALRQMPHRDSGMSPFDLVYGFNVRGPLDLVYAGWLDEACGGVTVSKWVETLQTRLSELTDLSVARRKRNKDQDREVRNRNRVDRCLKLGESVLMKVPGRSGVFQCSWEGPFQVKEVLSKVNYRVVGPNLPERGRVVHINNLKSYVERRVLRVAVAMESNLDKEACERPNTLGPEVCEGFDQNQLSALLQEFKTTFSDSPGCCEKSECTIAITEGSTPVNLPVRRIPFQLREGVEQAIQKMVADDIIEPSVDSEWCSPIVPVQKPDGTVRVCVDYRGLNDVTPLRRHYMPTLDELLDRAGNCGVLSTLDLTAGFHQLKVKEACRELTTFGSPWGKFRFKRMPFGLKNAPAIFQQVVDGVLEPCKDIAGCYIDDVLVFTPDWKTHLEALRRVLTCLKGAGFTVKLKKCSFGRKRLRYLGHLVGSGQVVVPTDRVSTLANYPMPVRKKQLKSFLGVVGFYRKFIKDFARDAGALTPMIRKEAPEVAVWTQESELSFVSLKNALCSFVCLVVPVPGDVFILHTDASAFAIGGCLHVLRDGEELPVVFYSRVLRGAELRYSVSEREALAIVCAVNHFDVYLFGREVTVKTDHRPNLALVDGDSRSDLNPRLRRFSLKLQGRVSRMVYVPGLALGNADGLSRMNEPSVDCVSSEVESSSIRDSSMEGWEDGTSS